MNGLYILLLIFAGCLVIMLFVLQFFYIISATAVYSRKQMDLDSTESALVYEVAVAYAIMTISCFILEKVYTNILNSDFGNFFVTYSFLGFILFWIIVRNFCKKLSIIFPKIHEHKWLN